MPDKATSARQARQTVAPGITAVHSLSCERSNGKRSCTCDPSFAATVSTGGRDQRERHRQTFSTLADAAVWLEDMKRSRRLGEPTEDAAPRRAPVPTVADAMAAFTARAWSGEVTARGGHPFSTATLLNYSGVMDRHVKPFYVERYGCTLGELRADLVDQKLMQAMADSIAAKGRRESQARAKAEAERTGKKVTLGTGTGTARMAVAALRRVLGDLSTRGLIDEVPPPPPNMPAPPKARERRIRMDQAAAIVRAAYADDERLGRSLIGPFVMVSTRTGARRNELTHLRWGADGVMIAPMLDADGEPVIDDDGEPMFTGALNIGRDTTKTDSGERTIGIDPGTAAALHRHRLACGNPPDGSWVFLNPPRSPKRPKAQDEPAPVSVDTLRAAFRRLSEATGIPALGTHLFRHSVTSWAVEAGVDIVTVAARMGHKDSSFTHRHYAHADRDRIAREPLPLDWQDAPARS